jgi:transposase
MDKSKAGLSKQRYRKGLDRKQGILLPPTMEEMVGADSPARVIDAFVDSLDMENLGFTHTQRRPQGIAGRPSWEPAHMLKLYLYGYLNRIRTTRKLQNECKRNLELIWLLGGLQPKYRAIAYFRADNEKGIRRVFRQFVVMMKSWDLIGGELLGVDGSKLRAVNSKKNNFNPRKIERHLKYIDEKIDEYLKQLDEQDKQENKEKHIKVQKCLDDLEIRKQKYQALEEQLKQNGDTQVSTTDPESRQLIIRGQVTEVAYNAQATVDDKHNLPIDYKALNTNDSKILPTMAKRAKDILQGEEFDLLADKGYHDSEGLQKCKDMKVTTYVAPAEYKHNKPVPTPGYSSKQFVYNTENDTYTCPQGEILTTNGNWYKKQNRNSTVMIKRYRTKACRNCPARQYCTTAPLDRGRWIERSQYQKAVEENDLRVKREKEKYRRRQAMVEHPFGVIKRQWGYDHVLVKGLGKVDAELGLIFAAYNLRRLMTIFGAKELIARLLTFFGQIRQILERYDKLKIFRVLLFSQILNLSYSLILPIFDLQQNQYEPKLNFCTN